MLAIKTAKKRFFLFALLLFRQHRPMMTVGQVKSNQDSGNYYLNDRFSTGIGRKPVFNIITLVMTESRVQLLRHPGPCCWWLHFEPRGFHSATARFVRGCQFSSLPVQWSLSPSLSLYSSLFVGMKYRLLPPLCLTWQTRSASNKLNSAIPSIRDLATVLWAWSIFLMLKERFSLEGGCSLSRCLSYMDGFSWIRS